MLGVVLLGDSIACFMRRWIAFPLGILLSLATIPLVVLQWNAFGPTYSIITIALAITATVLDGKAMISRTKLSEQSHPLNLPVFG